MTEDSSNQGPPGRDGEAGVDSASAKGRGRGWSLFKKRGVDLVDKLAGSVKDATRNPLVKQALEARERGNLAASFYLLEEAFTEKAEKDGDVEIAGVFWDVAVEYERAENAVHAVALLIRHYTGSNESELAAQYWSELAPRVSDALAEPSALIRIVPILQEQADQEEDEEARVQRQQVLLLALKAIVNPANGGLSPGLAVRTAELARELDPDTALAAAHIALEADDLHQAKRERLQHLICELDPNAPPPPPPAEPDPIPESIPEPDAEVDTGEPDKAGIGPARNHPLRTASPPAMGLSDAEAIALRAKLPPSQPGLVAVSKAAASTEAEVTTADAAQAIVEAVEQPDEPAPANTASGLDATPEASIGSTLEDAPDLDVDFNADSQPELEVDPFAESNPDIDVDLGPPARVAATPEPEPEPELEPESDDEEELSVDAAPEPEAVPAPEFAAAAASDVVADPEPSGESETDTEADDLLVSLEPVSDGPARSLPEPEVMVFDVPLEPSAETARFSDAKVIPGRATELDETGLWLDVQGGRRTRIEYDKIQALAVARIAELGDAPVAILDLLLNWNDNSEGPLRLVRLRSDEIDAEMLGGGASDGDAALIYVAAEILSQCHPIPLPDPDAVLTGNMPTFDSLAPYELEVLEVSR